MKIKLLLKQVRNDRGLSLSALASLSGLSQQYISRLEHGQQSPTLATIEKLCNSLQVQPGDLMMWVADA